MTTVFFEPSFSDDALASLPTYAYLPDATRQAYGGMPFLKGGLKELKSRQPGMMLLISLAITVAFVLWAWITCGRKARTKAASRAVHSATPSGERPRSGRGTVVITRDTECPVSQRYERRIAEYA